MKKLIRICSIVLVLALFINMLPMQALGEMYLSSTDTAIQTEKTNELLETKAVEIIDEVVENRTEFSKEHVLSNGLHQLTIYPSAVHYQTADGWEEIDNTLKANTDGTYTNTAGVWNVSMPQQLSATKPVTITKDGYTLSFAMAGQLRVNGLQAAVRALTGEAESLSVSSAGVAAAKIQKVDNSALKEAMEHPEVLPDKLASRLAYESVYANTDVLYDLDSNKVKESVVLRAYDSALRGYRYTLNVGTMIPVLEDDGQITFYTPDKKAVVMVMPAPFLVDDAKAYNYDVEVQLTGSGSSYTLTYLLPQEWLADSQRAWPVVLDPVVDADFSASNIDDHTVAETYTYSYTWGMGEVGYDDGYGAERFYIKYENLPALSSADVIVGATMQLCMDGHGENTPMQVHKVNGTWTSQTITWANQPGFNENVEDYAILDEPGYYAFAVTDIVRDWYAGENTGMVFRFSDAIEAGPTDNWIQFYSSDYGLNKPVLSVVFRNAAGLESYWDYTEASAGRAGTGYVNNFTGNLVWTKTHLGIGGNRMPVSISHVYNANNSAEDSFGLGNGWRTNYHQRVYQWSVDTSYYVWEDADGTKHYFLYDGDTNKYKDEDGLELTLTRTNTQTKACYIEDKNGNRSYFDDYGRLIKLENNQQTKSSNVITYTTTTGPQIYQIKDGVNRTYTFVYANGQLERINYTGTGTTVLQCVRFGYDGSNNLTSLTDIDGENNTYTYTTKKLLSSATDPNGYKISYGYNTVVTGKPSRVVSIAETANGTAGGNLAITYGHNQTKFVDSQNNTEIYQFNDFGNTVSVQDGEGHAQHASYAFHTDEQKENNTDPTKKTNQLSVSSKMQNTVGNRIRNSNFERSSYWTVSPADATCETVSTQAYLGSKSLHLDAEVRTTALSELFTIGPGHTYTFSAYVKGVQGKTYLHIGGENTTKSATVVATEGSTDWVRREVTLTNDTSANINVKAQLIAEAGAEVYMDCVQVEQAGAASRYNLLDNGDFIYSGSPAYSWISSTIDSSTDTLERVESSACPQLINRYVKIVGQPTQTKRVSQIFYHNGNAGDSYVFSGWAKGNSVPLQSYDSRGRKFELRIKFNYTDGTDSEAAQPFNPDTDEWQYASVAAVAEKAYSSVFVTFACDYNMNTFYFDGMQLYKEEFGSSYTYDENGNVISVTDLQGQTTTYEYENNNLTKEVLSTGAELQYTYDNYHNVKTATTQEGMEYYFTYDQWGNNTQVTVMGDSGNITATATYSADGNRLESATDALGKETKFCYNVNTNELEWVQYPEDTDGTNGTEDTRTKYTYDDLLRLVTTQADTNTGLELSASYTYADDNLSAIQTPSTVYAFTYGNFGLRSSVSAGNYELAEYTYTAKTHLLSELLYGNGHKATYTYDSKGRLTKLTYEDGDTVTYHYDNDSALAKVVDSATGTTTTYHYDLTGRMMKYVESGTDYSHTVGYTYDTKNNLTAQTETINGATKTTGYTYDNDNRVTAVTNGTAKKTYTYDDYGRTGQQQTKHGSTVLKTDSFTFTSPDGTNTSGQVASHTISATGFSKNQSYTYDDNGNIIKIVAGDMEITYVYDSANQLVRENNQVAGCTYTWEYDSAGNILNRKKYAYTIGELGTPIETVVYSYGVSSWGDLLTGYNGKTFTYDGVGNLLTDSVGRVYTWEHGRELATLEEATALYISEQPEDFEGLIGDGISFTVEARGEGLTYQWQVSGNDGLHWSDSGAPGYNTPTIYGFDVTTDRDGKLYRCKVTDSSGNIVYSQPGEIVARSIVIDSQPENFYGNIGDEISFSVTARGEGLTYQWQVSGPDGLYWNDSGANGYNTPTIYGFPVTESRYGNMYRCKITDSSGNVVYSQSGQIRGDVPAVTKQPEDVKGFLGEAISFTVETWGEGLTYRWEISADGGNYWENSYAEGYNTPTIYGFDITAVRHGRLYRCKITDSNGNVAYSEPGEIILATKAWNFTYNADGMRTKRTDGLSTYTYVYNGGQLSQMTNGTDTLRFSYDASGLPMALTYNGTYYYYVTNLQGDVIAILNNAGTVVTEYTYDAWGNPISTTGTMADTLGKLNPLRYRGYVYDEETGLYYLQSRYYDAEIGRFINGDGLISTGQEFVGNNMFAYCYNNPVMLADSLGTRPILSMSVSTETDERRASFDYMKALPYYNKIAQTQSDLQEMGFADTSYKTAKDCTDTLIRNGIDTAEEKAHFFSQCAHESNLGMWLQEYGSAEYLQNQPYYPYYGAGYIQLTWESNYQAFASAMNDQQILMQGPSYVAANYAWSAAGWYWDVRGINNAIANGASVAQVTRIVNGGTRGLSERQQYYNAFLLIFG